MEDFIFFEDWVRKNLKIDLASYKSKQMQRRILSKMGTHGAGDLKEYARLIGGNEKVRHEFINHITINVTEFFRNRSMFDTFEKEILGRHMAARKGDRLRVWSAACSNGSEPYSLSILFQNNGFNRTEILATDIDEQMLLRAREGEYGDLEMKGLLPGEQEKYFTTVAGRHRVRDTYKKRVTFQKHDLILDRFPAGFDVILCRNVLIYFNEDVKNRIFEQFYESLNPGGVLFIGATETIYNFSQMGFRKASTCIYIKG